MKTVLLTTTPVALGQKLNMPQHIHLLGYEICTALCMYVTWTFLHASDFKRAKQQKFSCHLHDRSGVTVNNSDISRNSRHLMHTHYKSHEVSSHSSTQLQRIFDYVKHETTRDIQSFTNLHFYVVRPKIMRLLIKKVGPKVLEQFTP